MLAVAAEVTDALAQGRPVVALESTIISHGMPYPRNVAMAVEVEQIIRDGGATPATIAILDGVPASACPTTSSRCSRRTPTMSKVSLRDLPHVSPAGATVRRRSRPRCGSRRSPASGCS